MKVRGGGCSSHSEEGVSVIRQKSVRLGFVLAVKSVQTELLLLFNTNNKHIHTEYI